MWRKGQRCMASDPCVLWGIIIRVDMFNIAIEIPFYNTPLNWTLPRPLYRVIQVMNVTYAYIETPVNAALLFISVQWFGMV